MCNKKKSKKKSLHMKNKTYILAQAQKQVLGGKAEVYDMESYLLMTTEQMVSI
jgi:hypothetical protein